ncbi:hypothetical protein L1987_20845 [Smallanthus sonchifolius]|uniref:Uncharacterized protein n=1 Tax=Smallanthus sonchifolius TaxID=185202 RepID=A0ACB9IUE8_9ASTR|nr:hypothetical protein L1987_20845 [Smallanthus sonchifolius]
MVEYLVQTLLGFISEECLVVHGEAAKVVDQVGGTREAEKGAIKGRRVCALCSSGHLRLSKVVPDGSWQQRVAVCVVMVVVAAANGGKPDINLNSATVNLRFEFKASILIWFEEIGGLLMEEASQQVPDRSSSASNSIPPSHAGPTFKEKDFDVSLQSIMRFGMEFKHQKVQSCIEIIRVQYQRLLNGTHLQPSVSTIVLLSLEKSLMPMDIVAWSLPKGICISSWCSSFYFLIVT